MTDEAQGPTPEEAPAPPASTRWSEDPVQDDDALSPPFVPGRDAAPPVAETPADADRTPEARTPGAPTPEAPAPEAPAPEASTPEAATPEDEPFPFEVADEGAEDEGAVDEVAVDEGAAAVPAGEDDFPFDEFDIEGDRGAESATEEASVVEVEPDVEAQNAGWTPADLDLGEADEAPTAPAAAPDAATEEAAAALDRLARLLRDEGEEGIRREMSASDRLAGVVAAAVAGYLAGRS